MKKALGRIVLVLASAALTLLAAEIGLRLLDPTSGQRRSRAAGRAEPIRRAEPPNRLDTITVHGVGGSSLLGEPYDEKITLLGLVIDLLAETYPQLVFDEGYTAEKGASMRRLYPHVTGALESGPGLLVLYAGHNEFLGEFSDWQQCPERESSSYRLLRGSRLYEVVHSFLQRRDISKLPVGGNRSFFDAPVVCRAQWNDVLADYRRMVESIALGCAERGVPAVLVFPASNEAGFNPNRSVYGGPADQTERFRALYSSARLSLRAGDFVEAERALRRALDIDDGFAELWYRLGRSLERQGRPAEAREAYRLARELDGNPWRALDAQRQALADAAAVSGCVFLDGAEIVAGLSETGLAGDDLFWDIHHPRLPGYQALARAIAQAVIENDLLRAGPAALPAARSEAELLERYRFDRDDWLELHVVRVAWLWKSSQITYFPSDRLELLRRHLEALRAYGDAGALVRAEESFMEVRSAAGIEEAWRRWRELAAKGREAGLIDRPPPAS